MPTISRDGKPVAAVWEVTTARGVEQFLKLADRDIQAACIRMGGRNQFGQPNYRVVWGPSCYVLAGDWDANRSDEHGNLVPIGTVTCAVPKYPNAFPEAFVLEHWKPKEFYYLIGRQGVEVEWNGLATLRKAPPIPERGDYEAVEMAMGQPFCMFNRYRQFVHTDGRAWEAAPMTPLVVEAAIRMHWDGMGQTEKEWFHQRAVKKAAADAEAKDFYRDWADDAIGPYGSSSAGAMIPHSGYRGPVQVEI